MKKLTEKQKTDIRKKIEPVLSAFDHTNKLLKLKFNVSDANYLNYVTDNGVIKNGWLLTNKKDINHAITVLEKQSAPVYILGSFYGAIFSWDAIRSIIICGLWRNSKKVEETRSIDTSEISSIMNEWFDRVIKGDMK